MNEPRIKPGLSRRSASILALALAATLNLGSAFGQPEPATAANADDGAPVDQAREHFLRGVDFYRESDYRAAIIEFERAYEISPNYKVLYNMGQAHLELQGYAAALDAFERFLSEGGDKVSDEQRDAVQHEIEKLSGRVARVDLTVDKPGATVLIDDVVVGVTPLTKPITLSTGRRKLTIRKEGHIPISQRIDVAGGDSLNLSFTLTPVASKAPEPDSSPAPVMAPTQPQAIEQDRGMGTPFWASLVATGVFATGAGVFGYEAIRCRNENQDQLETAGVRRIDLETSKSDTQRYALGTDILLGATLMAGGLTLYFGLDGDDEGATRVGVSPGRATLSGSF